MALKCKKMSQKQQKTAEKLASYRKKPYLCSAIVQNE